MNQDWHWKSGAAILAGKSWLKPERNRERQSKGQVLSPYGRMLLRNAMNLFLVLEIPTICWYKNAKNVNNLAAVIARYVPWLVAGLVNSIYQYQGELSKIQLNSTP